MINDLINKINTDQNLKSKVKNYSFLRKTPPTVSAIRTNSRETVYSLGCISHPSFKAQPLKDIFEKAGLPVFKKQGFKQV